MKYFIILHNMIVEDGRDNFLFYTYNNHTSSVITQVRVTQERRILFAEFVEKFSSVTNKATHELPKSHIKGSKVCEDFNNV
jgi:hypothetical protein